MDWIRKQEEPQEAPNTLTPEDDDECYFEEDASIDEGMVCEISRCVYSICGRLKDWFDRLADKNIIVLIFF